MKFIWLFLLLMGSEAAMSSDNENAIRMAELNEQASQYYGESDWNKAIVSYSQLLKIQPSNEQAWYRIAHANIQLEQGKQALAANQHLASATQIPAHLVLYQKAQALNLMGQEQDMWHALEQAATAGYRNINDLDNNPIWKNAKEHKQFLQVKQWVDKNVRPCMYDDSYRQFDFWLGQWEVYGNLEKTGPLFGHNSISRTEQGCLIMEQWRGASGSTGTSMNYYDGIQKQWVQRWVSGGGIVIDYAGGLINNEENTKSMQLIGKIYYAATQQQPQIRDFRGTWTPLADGVVRQFFEESIDGGAHWYSWFDGYYFPIKEVDNNEK